MKQWKRKSVRILLAAACLTLFSLWARPVLAEEAPKENELYAKAAVLLDGESGRILYSKNGQKILPMASTTKIMTCILALENAGLQEEVTVSGEAASQPQVRLGIRTGQVFAMEDLLYALMLESDNDVAVAVAEHVGGSVEGFAELMNQKAKELGAARTNFVTPNGLDAAGHHTTAADLARILRYCLKESPQKEKFLEITGSASHQFTDVSGKSSYACQNHNALLTTMAGAVSGKTGFTGSAGYCYVGAAERDGKTLIVAVLASGWPPNKNWKWADVKKLMEYGFSSYEYREAPELPELPEISVTGGVPDEGLSGSSTLKLKFASLPQQTKWLLREDETVECRISYEKELEAPVAEGTAAGKAEWRVGDVVLEETELCTEGAKGCRDFGWCLEKVLEIFCV